MSYDGPLPQWTPIEWGGPYEATAPDGTVWRLSLAEGGWLLAPRDKPDKAEFISGEGGLYSAIDEAGERIAAHRPG